MATLHPDERDTSIGLARQLVRDHYPAGAGLELHPTPFAGTDHVIYRLGDDLQIRLPRIPGTAGIAEVDFRYLPGLATRLPQEVPAPIFQGQPTPYFPLPWSIYRWVPGDTVMFAESIDLDGCADDLSRFLRALHEMPVPEDAANDRALNKYRGRPLHERDEITRECLAEMGDLVDESAVLAAWEECLDAPEWQQPPRWFHGDLYPPNILVNEGRLCGIIDFGCLGVGDPACDLIPAWTLFSGASRGRFRELMEYDDATWTRARGKALSQAVVFIPYYRESNPRATRHALQLLRDVLSDRTP